MKAFSLIALVLLMVASPVFAVANLSMNSMLSMLISLVIIALIFWAVWWFLGYVGIPEPFNKVARVIIGLIALIVVINLLLSLNGTSLFNIH